MRVVVAIIALSGPAILTVTLVILGGGNNMSIRHNDIEASMGLTPSDTHHSGKFETATFALG